MELNKANMKKILLLVAGSVLIFYLIFNFFTVVSLLWGILKIFSPFIAGCCVAFVLNIPMSFFERCTFNRFKFFNEKKAGFIIKRITCIFVALAFLSIVITGVVFVVMPELANTMEVVWNKAPQLISDALIYIKALFERFPSIANEIGDIKTNWDSIRQNVISFVTTGIWGVSGVISTVFSGVTTTVIAFIFALYILAQKETLSKNFNKIIYAFFSEKTSKTVLYVLNRTSKTFSNFISGQCVECLIEGIVFFVVLYIFGFQSSGVIAVILGFTALIPIVGTFIGAVLSILLILVFDPLKTIWFVILFGVVQQITNNLIYPRVVGSSIGLPGILVLLAVTVGGSLFGVIGMLIMVPACSLIYTFFNEYIERRLAKNNIISNQIQK